MNIKSIELIQKERIRQIQEEGFSLEQDDQLGYGELALAGVSYAMPVRLYQKVEFPTSIQFIDPYPWSGGIGDKRKDYAWEPFTEIPEHKHLEPNQQLDLLVKGAALIAAEIDKLLRAQEYGITE